MDGLSGNSELDESPVAHELDDTAMMFRDRRVYQLLAVGLERSQGAHLIELHEAAVSDHIGDQDRSEAALHSHSPSARRLTTTVGEIHADEKALECPLLARNRHAAAGNRLPLYP